MSRLDKSYWSAGNIGVYCVDGRVLYMNHSNWQLIPHLHNSLIRASPCDAPKCPSCCFRFLNSCDCLPTSLICQVSPLLLCQSNRAQAPFVEVPVSSISSYPRSILFFSILWVNRTSCRWLSVQTVASLLPPPGWYIVFFGCSLRNSSLMSVMPISSRCLLPRVMKPSPRGTDGW